MNKRRFLKSLFGIAGAAIAAPAAAKLPTAGPWDGMTADEVLDYLTAPIKCPPPLLPVVVCGDETYLSQAVIDSVSLESHWAATVETRADGRMYIAGFALNGH